MRILITLTLTISLVLVISMAHAAHPGQQSGNPASLEPNSHTTGSPGVTTLQLSLMYVEIQQVLDQAGETERLLLRELEASTEDQDVQRSIRRITRLEMDREVEILKIQARYARLEGRWNLDYWLRSRIMEILENEIYAAKYVSEMR